MKRKHEVVDVEFTVELDNAEMDITATVQPIGNWMRYEHNMLEELPGEMEANIRQIFEGYKPEHDDDLEHQQNHEAILQLIKGVYKHDFDHSCTRVSTWLRLRETAVA